MYFAAHSSWFNPVSKQAGALYGPGFPVWSHIRTFHQNRAVSGNALPAYSIEADWSESTLPLSQQSAFSSVNPSMLEATNIWYAICLSPRVVSADIQVKRVASRSMANG